MPNTQQATFYPKTFAVDVPYDLMEEERKAVHNYQEEFPFEPVPDNLKRFQKIIKNGELKYDPMLPFVNVFIENCSLDCFDKFTFWNFELKNSGFTGEKKVCLMAGNGLFYQIEMKNKELLPNSHIQKVNFVKCNLSGSDFSRSNISDVHFIDCDLRNADFKNMNLKNCMFKNCLLDGANFDGAGLPEHLKSAIQYSARPV